MKKLSVLSSTLVVSMLSFGAYAALGEDVIEGGPNTCTVDVLGVTENDETAYAIATWELKEYDCPPGTHLIENETGDYECAICPSGTFCMGGNVTIESKDQEAAVCPVAYPFSDAGADSMEDCYINCTVANANIDHATSVTGKKYYGGDSNTCVVIECEDGYEVNVEKNLCEQTACPVGQHLEPVMTVIKKEPIVAINPTNVAGSYARLDGTGSYYSDLGIEQKESGLTENNTWVHVFTEGNVYGRASCQATVSAVREYLDAPYDAQRDISRLDALLDGDITIENIPNNITDSMSNLEFLKSVIDRYENGEIDKTEAYFELYSVFYSDKGVNYNTNSSGQYCYCQITGFIPNSGTKMDVSGAPWVLHEVKFDSDSQCQESCSEYCAKYSVDNYPEMHGFVWALLDMFDKIETVNECRANIIKIDWNPDNNGAHTLNTCVYGGDVTLPDDPKKAGYEFTGWKIDTSKYNTTE